ncbi:MAG: 3-oxoadipate enol-lactonase [Pseudochelatococcus sp.]|jgi:3-oxoadipate enol-lactonase|uniref:3-oxoadipate enol-lactonase n=1 Tax=Pseudochelatococcus sp. TaxID=2020869 RepID=UPI003D8C0797
MAFARINDIVLHYRVRGDSAAPALVLVNSLGTDGRIWDELADLLAPRYRIVSYDKRGHGLSDAPKGDYTLDDHVADLAGLANHLGIDRLALAGVSVGGLIAQGFALRHADRLAALVLCDTAAKFGDADMWNGRIAAVRTGGMAALADTVILRWFPESYRREKPDAVAGWKNMLTRTPAAGYAGTCATLRDTDLRPLTGGIAAPTLVVVGDEDLSSPPALVRQTAEAIPGARYVEIAGAGHIPFIEQPGAMAALIDGFLRETGHSRPE